MHQQAESPPPIFLFMRFSVLRGQSASMMICSMMCIQFQVGTTLPPGFTITLLQSHAPGAILFSHQVYLNDFFLHDCFWRDPRKVAVDWLCRMFCATRQHKSRLLARFRPAQQLWCIEMLDRGVLGLPRNINSAPGIKTLHLLSASASKTRRTYCVWRGETF